MQHWESLFIDTLSLYIYMNELGGHPYFLIKFFFIIIKAVQI